MSDTVESLLTELSGVIYDRQNDLTKLVDALGMPRGKYMPMSPKDVHAAALQEVVDLRAQLLAANARAEKAEAGLTEAVEALPLDWQETYADRGDGSQEVDGWEAASGFGTFYTVETYFGSDSFGWEVKFDYDRLGDFDDLDSAKACAQADFAKRVARALSDQEQT